MTVGNKSRLTATVCPDNATDKSVMWWSNEPFVAVVDVDGNVTALNPGSAVIYAVTTDGSNLQACCSVSVIIPIVGKITNCLFDISKKECIKSEFVELLGERKTAVSVNTTAECIDIVLQYDIIITNLANCFGIPKSLIQTIMLRELWCLNIADAVGDGEVINYFAWKEDCEYWENQSSLYQSLVPYPDAPIPLKDDSSTGLCQIFASTAIKAYNEAIELGYIFGSKIDITDWKQCRDVWFSLKNNNEYNINMATLNILSCINEYCYSFDFGNYTPSMYKQVFTRYNADMNTINDYGQECYKYFLIFNKY